MSASINSIVAPFEFKFSTGDTPGAFEGYGAIFGNVDSYGDVIKPGAFKRTLKEWRAAKSLPPMLSQHGGWAMSSGDLMPIGVWTDMREDEKGLWCEGVFADTPRGQEAYALCKMQPRPALDGLSIGYRAKEFSNGVKPEEPRRTLKDVELIEVSLVTMPANPKARITGVKAWGEPPRTIREFEGFLRDVGGFSAAAAKAIASSGFKSMTDPRDEAGQDSDATALAARFRALRGAV